MGGAQSDIGEETKVLAHVECGGIGQSKVYRHFQPMAVGVATIRIYQLLAGAERKGLWSATEQRSDIHGVGA